MRHSAYCRPTAVGVILLAIGLGAWFYYRATSRVLLLSRSRMLPARVENTAGGYWLFQWLSNYDVLTNYRVTGGKITFTAVDVRTGVIRDVPDTGHGMVLPAGYLRPGDALQPMAVSPNGKWILCNRVSGQGFSPDYVAFDLGSGETRTWHVSSGMTHCDRVGWLPDSMAWCTTAIASEGAQPELCVYNVKRGAVRRLTISLPGVDRSTLPEVLGSTSNGEMLLGVWGNDERLRIYRVDASAPRAAAPVASIAPPLRGPMNQCRVDMQVSPNGTSIVWEISDPGKTSTVRFIDRVLRSLRLGPPDTDQFRLLTSNLDGSNMHELGWSEKLLMYPRWRPDGREISFGSGAPDGQDWPIFATSSR